jgi:hypothetical protein
MHSFWLRTTRIYFAPDAPPAGGDQAAGSWGTLDADAQKVVTDNGWKSPADAVKNYAGLSTKIGTMISIPGTDAKPEEIAAFHGKLGVPADGKYDLKDFKRPENLPWDEGAQTNILARLSKAGATPAAARAALDGYVEYAAGVVKARDDFAAKVHAETEPAMRKAWGDKYDANYAAANKAVASIFGKSVEEATKLRLEDGSFILDHPALAEAFAKFGATLQEDGDLGGRNDSAGDGGASSDIAKMTPQQAEAEIAKVRAEAVKDDKHPYNDRGHPDYKKTQQRMNELYARKNAGRAAVVD